MQFIVRVWDKDALTGNIKGNYIPQLQTNKLSEAALFMEKQSMPSCLSIDGRIICFIHPKGK